MTTANKEILTYICRGFVQLSKTLVADSSVQWYKKAVLEQKSVQFFGGFLFFFFPVLLCFPEKKNCIMTKTLTL